MTIDGRQVHSVENTDPRTFTNVRVFAGDKFKPAADASYKNFNAGPGFNIGSNTRKNNQIGTIDSWGPLFHISFDLIIHSFDYENRQKSKHGYFSVLAFKGKQRHGLEPEDCCKNGDRIPVIMVVSVNKELVICFAHSVNKNGNYYFQDFHINLETWYNIEIEQEYVDVDRSVSKTSSPSLTYIK